MNILCDRMLFDEWDLAQANEPMKVFLRDELKRDSSVILADKLATIVEDNTVMDKVVLKRPDFINVFLHFTLKANEALQHDCLNLLYQMLQCGSST